MNTVTTEESQLTVTPSQVAAPVQLETLPVAVRRADGESVARQEVRSPRAALGQSLRLVQLLTLRTLLCSRSGHGNISRVVPRRCGGGNATADESHVRSRGWWWLEKTQLQHNRDGLSRGVCFVSSTASLEAFSWGGGEGGGRKIWTGVSAFSVSRSQRPSRGTPRRLQQSRLGK